MNKWLWARTEEISTQVAEIRPPYTGGGLNLGDRVLGEVERNSFIALPGKGGHNGLMPSGLCVPPWRG